MISTVLPERIIIPMEQVERTISPEFTQKSSEVTIDEKENWVVLGRPALKVSTVLPERIIIPMEQVERTISAEFTQKSSEVTIDEKENWVVLEKSALMVSTVLPERIIIPTEQVERTISPEFTQKSSEVTIDEKDNSVVLERTALKVSTALLETIITPTEQVERTISPEFTENSFLVTLDEKATSAIKSQVAEKVVDISVKNDTELRKSLIDRCEKTVIGIVEQLCAGQLPSVSYKMSTIETLMGQLESLNPESVSMENQARCAGFEACSVFETPESMDTESVNHESEESPMDTLGQRRVVDFGSERSRNKLALMMITMAKVHGLLDSGRTETRRSLFYELKGDEDASRLVNKQQQVDRIVNNLANLLECAPWEMGLVASAKGLAAGEMTLRLSDDREINFASLEGALIPRNICNVTSIRTKAKLVIVVEKDTVFQKLLDENCPDRLNCILITGKGFPDVATRMLVKILAEKVELPVYILVDADPYGVEIMLTYKYGSIALSCERESLACPSIRWLGLHPSELPTNLRIPTIPLTDADISKLGTLRSRPYVDEMLSRELKIMKNGKSEIEAIGGNCHDSCWIVAYLQMKIDSDEYI